LKFSGFVVEKKWDEYLLQFSFNIHGKIEYIFYLNYNAIAIIARCLIAHVLNNGQNFLNRVFFYQKTLSC